MLAGIFESFRNMSLKIYELDPAHFLTVTRLTWQVCLKKTKVELKILTDADIFLVMIEKGIRVGICDGAYQYVKTNNKYMKNHDLSIESLYFM